MLIENCLKSCLLIVVLACRFAYLDSFLLKSKDAVAGGSNDTKFEHRHDTSDHDTRIPFWNIAHMINSIEQIDVALR